MFFILSFVVCILECNGVVDEILAQDGVRHLCLTVSRDIKEVVSLDMTGLLEYFNDSLLDLLVRVVDVDENLLDRVRVQA